jgi:hypothetical protein
MPDTPLSIWQSALLSQGCQVHSAGQFFPLELHPVGDRIVGTPTVSGSLLPFNITVAVGQPVTITWDTELSRYIVTADGPPKAA